eukprot:CAMPEP_0198428446 /NCGR_PEP_ID=MMETSP1452-20131203/6563_1 /TAXON_ID=1181717 /ORGANISM="Synchroma pusillum, Strain CCMP3072" /LENGTH=198 /DNA_ID=CAMNT_0044148841 /DNA_START=28 /DNA_END=624 /DNA_ORIENTATION=+
MNLRECQLEEMEVHESNAREAVACLLHTLLFIRAPATVRPRDTHCPNLDLTYARCGTQELDRRVDAAYEQLTQSLSPAGPELSRGEIVVAFFERRKVKGFFGFVDQDEKVVWEQWKVPLVVNHMSLPAADGGVVHGHAREQLEQRMLKLFDFVNSSIDHVPPSTYDFEINCQTLTSERRDSIVGRLMTQPVFGQLNVT